MSGPVAYGCPICGGAVMRWSWTEHVKECEKEKKRESDNSHVEAHP